MRDLTITIDYPITIDDVTINVYLQVPKEYVGIDILFSIERKFREFASYCESAQKDRRLTRDEEIMLEALSMENARLEDIYYPTEC